MDYKYIEETRRIVALDGEKEAGAITYSDTGNGVWIFDHTYVEPEYRGGPIAETLLDRLVEIARKNKVKIIPQCSYVRRKFDKIPEYQELEHKA